MFVAGTMIIVVFVLSALIGPEVASEPRQFDRDASLEGASLAHLFGTNRFGQDVFSQSLSAARESMKFALITLSTGFVAGTVVGSLCIYRWQSLRALFAGASAYVLAVPVMVLYFLLFTAFARDHWDTTKAAPMAAIALALGLRTAVLIDLDRSDLRRSLARAWPLLIEGACWATAAAILFETGVGFMFGPIAAEITFGGLIEDNSASAIENWTAFLAPGFAVTFIVLGFLMIAMRLAVSRHEAERAPQTSEHRHQH
jgi:peptide/nickel transport system permease protein